MFDQDCEAIDAFKWAVEEQSYQIHLFFSTIMSELKNKEETIKVNSLVFLYWIATFCRIIVITIKIYYFFIR